MNAVGPGEKVESRFADEPAETMRRAIRDAGGREVYFAGVLDRNGIVEKVRVHARGNEGAVPAILERLRTRDVVIHNHPSGDLEPSEADLDIASICGNNGHGVYIVDNEVSSVYVVVEPFLPKDLRKLDVKELAKLLGPSGPVAKVLPDYEVRPQQIEMLDSVATAFNEEHIAVVEAPTGVGKSLAYLLPAVTWAVQNRERVVISTKTINLQEQIVFKDIPLLRSCLDLPFEAVLVKGRQNYLCPMRLSRALSEATLFDDESEVNELKALVEWAEHTDDGSKSDLSFVPSRQIWERVCSEADICTAAQCKASPKTCFVTRARRDVAKADLVVVNHHMLFSDLAIKKESGSFSALAVLPPFQRLILDEAHHVEDSATEYFGIQATRSGAVALLGRLIRHERGHDRGLIPFIRAKLPAEARSLTLEEIEELFQQIENNLLPALAVARQSLEAAFDALRSLTAETSKQIGKDIKWRLTDEIVKSAEMCAIHNGLVLPAKDEVNQLAKHCTVLHEKLKAIRPERDEDEQPLGIEIAQLQSYRDRLLRLAAALSECTSDHIEENTVRWIEIDAANSNIVRLIRCPLEVGPQLAEWVYPNLKSVVMTSATLSVKQSFDFLFNRIGIDLIRERVVDARILDSPFDFERQALLCVPDDVVAPDHANFLEQSTDYLREALAITKGRAFVLFTSFYAINYAHAKLESGLRKAGATPLKQGSASRTQLLDRFRADISSVLFATDSFWEGVDVAGEALACVILPRLPFRVPTEPILQARSESIEANGGNAFMDYTVPLAVIKFRQGFGRLIRRKTDRGAVLLLDSRVLKKRYGKIFLESLPGLNIVTGSREKVFESFQSFYELENEGGS